jgi:putative peptidoglycan lipid II flippase
MIKRLFHKKTHTIGIAALIIGISSIVSALLGLLRDRLLASQFGAGLELDIYYAAFRIPDLVFGILISGGIIAAFLPVFSEYYQKDEKEAWKLTSNTLNIFLLFSIVLCAILAIFAPQLIKLIVPGFDPSSQATTVLLTRIMFLSPIFFGISNIFSSILHYFNHFVSFSLAPILYNVGIIIGILFFVPIFGIVGLAYGVVLGVLMHWLIQIPSVVLNGFKYRPILDFKSVGLKKILFLMIPRTISAIIANFNLIIVTAIASTIGVGNISIFNFSDHLRALPITVIGGSFAVAAYPFMAKAWADGKKDLFISKMGKAFKQSLFLIVPLSVVTLLLRAQIVRIILGTGKFGWLETQLTAASLGIFAISIFAYALSPFLVRIFFSVHDTKTPLFTSIISLGTSIAFSFIFVKALSSVNWFSQFIANVFKLNNIDNISVIGLPLAITVSGIIQVILLLFLLKRKIKEFPIREIGNTFHKVLIASVIMGGVLYYSLQIFGSILETSTFIGILLQTILSGIVAGLSYLFFSYLLKIEEVSYIKNLFFKK